MNLFLPSISEIRESQKRDERLYFSAAFDVVLRRHGVVVSEQRGAPHGFVARETPWQHSFENQPLVFEGPLHTSVVQRFRLKARIRTAEQLYATPPDGQSPTRLEFPRARPDRRDRIADTPDLRIGTSWDATRFSFQEFELDEGDSAVLLGGDWGAPMKPIATRRGSALLLGAPLFDLMARYDAMPPYDRGYPGLEAWSDLAGLESWLISAAETLAVDSGTRTLRLGLWPHPHRWALTVRHDVDRPLDRPARDSSRVRRLRYRQEVRRRLRLYRQRGICSTWFWLESSIHSQTMRRIASRGHEIALHTEATSLDRLLAELASIEKAVRRRVQGMSAHGGGRAPGHLGLHHTEWAVAANLEYGERIGGGFYVGAAVAPRAEIPTLLPLMMPGQHIGTERGLGPDQSNIDAATEWLTRVVEQGGHAVLMNHPDVHFDALRTLLGSLPDGAWSATLGQTSRWARVVQFAERTEDGVAFPSPLPYPASLRIGRKDGWSQVVLPTGTIYVTLTNDSSAVATSADGRSTTLTAEALPRD